MARDI